MTEKKGTEDRLKNIKIKTQTTENKKQSQCDRQTRSTLTTGQPQSILMF